MDNEKCILINAFVEESEKLLGKIADGVIKAEAEADCLVTVNFVFRGIQAIKGNAAMLGATEISLFAHSMEAILNAIRDEELALDSDIVDLVLSGCDDLGSMIQLFKAGETIKANEELMRKYNSFGLPASRPENSVLLKTAEVTTMVQKKETHQDKLAGETGRDILPFQGGACEAAEMFAALAGQEVNFYKIKLTHTAKDLAVGKDPRDVLNTLQNNAAAINVRSTLVFDSDDLRDFLPLAVNIKADIHVASALQEFELYDLCDNMLVVDLEALPANSHELPPEETSSGQFSIDVQDLREFLDGCYEHIEIMEKAVIDYEKSGSDSAINELFRSAHTIKGDAGYMQMEQTAKFAHELENLLYRLRAGELTRTVAIIELLLKSVDALRDIVDRLARGEKLYFLPAVYNDLRAVGGLTACELHEEVSEETSVPDELHALEKDTREVFLYQIIQQHDLLKRYGKPPLAKEQREIIGRALAGLKSAANFVKLPSLNVIVDRAFAAIAEDEAQLVGVVSSLDSFITGLKQGPKALGQILVDEGKVCQEDVAAALKKQKTLGEILVEQGKVTELDVRDALSQQKPVGKILVEEGKINEEDVNDALQKQEMIEVAGQLQEIAINKEIRTMRVDEDKIEKFSNLIGEMLIARNSYEYLLSRSSCNTESADGIKNLKDNLHLFSRLVDDMHHGIMAMRMIPIQGIFNKFNRVVRDIARKQDKKINLVLLGEETEIDKKVADIISDPLIHLIRNSCDHGIEMPAARKAANKPETGTVILSASQEGGNLLIKVIDDGNGIDGEQLKAKAVKKGVDVENMSESSILGLIFIPGLSTKEESTDLSGRGVGMDVVKSTIDSLKGKVQVYSEMGKGSELTLAIPMVMGISVILLVEIAEQSYGIPFEHVLEAIKISPSQLHFCSKSMIFHYRDQVIPVDFLENYLADNGALPKTVNFKSHEELSLVILKAGNRNFAVIVDSFVRNMEVAIKPLPGNLIGIDLFSGSSILGNGQLILILNPEKIV